MTLASPGVLVVLHTGMDLAEPEHVPRIGAEALPDVGLNRADEASSDLDRIDVLLRAHVVPGLPLMVTLNVRLEAMKGPGLNPILESGMLPKT